MLNNIQERIERSIFVKILKALVEEGYTPNILDENLYPETELGNQAYETALQTIVNTKSFAVDIFNHSSSRQKGTKKVPRIVIIPQRITTGDIGTLGTLGYAKNPNNPNLVHKTEVDLQSSHLYYDINLVTKSATQSRVLNAILYKAIGVKRHIPLYDDPNDLFLMVQSGNFDLPNDVEGIDEQVYTYQIPDVYLYNELSNEAIVPISEINIDTMFVKTGENILDPTSQTGEIESQTQIK